MRVLLRGCVALLLVGAGLGVVWAEPAIAAVTSTVGDTEVGVLAYAGSDPTGDSDEAVNHDGNASVTATDSDSGPDGNASITATLSSTASTTEITVDGTASTSQDGTASASINTAHVYLDTVLGESGYWAYEGSFDTTSSDLEYDACISGSIRLKIYPPGEDVEEYNLLAQVNSCEDGSGHATFGDIDGAGVAVQAGARFEIIGSLSGPNGDAPGTSSASFTLDVVKKPGTPPPPPTPVSGAGAPTVTGTGVVGTALSAGTGTWNGDPSSFTYRWRADGVNISGATGSTYTVKSTDVGKVLVCRVTAYNATSSASQDSAGVLGQAASTPTAPPAPPPTVLANTARPVVTGKYVVGKKLTASPGTWSQAPTSTTYQWLRNGKPIKGATSFRYKTTKKDKGKKVSVVVTATAPGYLDGTSTSPAKKVKPKPKND